MWSKGGAGVGNGEPGAELSWAGAEWVLLNAQSAEGKLTLHSAHKLWRAEVAWFWYMQLLSIMTCRHFYIYVAYTIKIFYIVILKFFQIWHIQWGKKVFSQPPIVQVLPLKKMREACNFHHRYTSTMRDKIRKKNPENHIVGFLKNLFANYGGK